MIACNVVQVSKEVSPVFSADDLAKIKRFSKSHSKVTAAVFFTCNMS